MKLRILLVGLMIALGSSAARATTYTALSSAESAVAIEVALTVNGDTVQIPCSPRLRYRQFLWLSPRASRSLNSARRRIAAPRPPDPAQTV